jgi:hypothetical protein
MSEIPKRRNPWKKRVLVTLLVLAIVFAGIYWYIATEKFSDTSDRKAAHTVSVNVFFREFQQNEQASKEKYAGKIVAINGRVSEIEPADTTLNIKFTDTATGNYAIFAFQKQHLLEAKTIKLGDSVSIKAAFSDYVYSSILDVHYITFQRAALNK